MRYMASCSFGKDSLAMVLRLMEQKEPLDEVVFYDTGMEFQAIYNLRDAIQPMLKERGIKYTELHPTLPFTYSMFDRPVITRAEHNCQKCKYFEPVGLLFRECTNPKSRYFGSREKFDGESFCENDKGCKHIELREYTKFGYSWCGGVCRWGTTEKLKRMDELAETEGAMVYVGIAADETQRLNKERKPYKIFPLADWGMSEKDCLDYCYDRGFFWDEDGIRLYDILDRVSCWCCANKNRKELKNIWLHLPQYWEKLEHLQSRLDRPMKKFVRKGVPYGNVFDMRKVFEEESS